MEMGWDWSSASYHGVAFCFTAVEILLELFVVTIDKRASVSFRVHFSLLTQVPAKGHIGTVAAWTVQVRLQRKNMLQMARHCL